MKKLKLFLFAFTLLFTLLGFNANNTASAETATTNRGILPAGCTSTRGYSPLTGVKCDTVIDSSLPAGCTSTRGYSPTTGVKCDSATTSTLPVGCVSTFGFSVTTGKRCGSESAFPPGCASYSGYSSTTGEPCGSVSTSNSPVISGVSGPQSLDVSRQGTWTVKASSPNGGNLSYSVVWGDESYLYSGQSSASTRPAQQSATFEHSYSQAGMYTPTFTVTSENTIRCITTPCPSNAGSAQTSLSVNVGNTTNLSSINVISPNGGETFIQGGTISGSYSTSNIPFGTFCEAAIVGRKADGSPVDATIATGKTVASDVQRFSGTIPSNLVPPGKYKIRVDCGNIGNSIPQDQSDETFAVTSPQICPTSGFDPTTGLRCGCTSTSEWSSITGQACGNSKTSSVVITSPYANSSWKMGTQQIIKWTTSSSQDPHIPRIIVLLSRTNGTEKINITDQKDGYFPYLGSYPIGSDFSGVKVNVPQLNVGEGNYGIFQVVLAAADSTPDNLNDNKILSERVLVTIEKEGSITPSITVLYPNGGEQIIKGSVYNIKWNSSNTGNSSISIRLFNSQDSGVGIIAERIPNTGSYLWTVPTTYENGNYKIVIYNDFAVDGTASQATSDKSDSFFTITSLTPEILGSVNSGSLAASVINATSFRFTQFLEEGSRGNEVRELQKFLNGAGYDVGTIDGVFSATVKEALIRFQITNGLKGDGIVGFEVRSFLNR